MQALNWRDVVVETDHATFVHITQPVWHRNNGKKSVDGVLKDCFDKHEGVLVSNTGPTETDTKVREYLKQTQIDEQSFLAKTTDEQAKQAKHKQLPPLSTKVAFCLLIPANPQQFDKKSDRSIIRFVQDQTVPETNDNDVVKKLKEQLDNVSLCTTSKQYVTLELYCKEFLALNVHNLYPYFVDVFYALHKLHSQGIAHGWVRTHSVCVSKLDPTTSSQDVCAGLARFDYSYDMNYGPIMEHHDTILQNDFVDPDIKALYNMSDNVDIDVFHQYAAQLDLYALFVVIYKLLDTKRSAFTDDNFRRWVAACTSKKEDKHASSLSGVHKCLDGVEFSPAGDCCIGLLQAFGLASSPDDAKSWMIARYKPGPPKVKPTTKVTFGQSLKPTRYETSLSGTKEASTSEASTKSSPSEASTKPSPNGDTTSKSRPSSSGASTKPSPSGASTQPSSSKATDLVERTDESIGEEPEADYGYGGDVEDVFDDKDSATLTRLVDCNCPDVSGESRRVVCLKWESKTQIQTTTTTETTTETTRGAKHDAHKIYVHNELTTSDLTTLVNREQHLMRFRPKQYLDDNHMNMFNQLIPLEKHVFITVCAAKKSLGIGRQPEHLCPTLSHTLVYIPIVYKSIHWFFIRVNRDQNIIEVFDSFIGIIRKTAYLGLITNAMKQFGFGDAKYTIEFTKTLQQQESECGFFVCLRIWYACTNQDGPGFKFEELGAYKEPPRLFMARCILENYIPVILRDSFVDVFPNQYLVATDRVTWEAWRSTRTKLNDNAPTFLRYITQPPGYPMSFTPSQAAELNVESDRYFGVSRTVLPLNSSTYLLLATRKTEPFETKRQAKARGCQIAKETILRALEQMKTALYGYDDLKSFMHLAGVVSALVPVIQLPFVLRKYATPSEAQTSYEASIKAVEDVVVTTGDPDDDDEVLVVLPDDQDDASLMATFRGSCETVKEQVEKALNAQLDVYTARVVTDLWNSNQLDEDAWVIVNTALLTAVKFVDFTGFTKHITRPDGNCYYQCVCKALGKPCDRDGVKQMRRNIYDYFVGHPDLLTKNIGAVSEHHVKQYLVQKKILATPEACSKLLAQASKDVTHEYFKWYFTTNGIYADQFGIIVAATFADLNYVEAKFVVDQQACENVLKGENQRVVISVNTSCEEICDNTKFMVLLFSGLSNSGHFDLLMPTKQSQKVRRRVDTDLSPQIATLSLEDELEAWLTKQGFHITKRVPLYVKELRKLVRESPDKELDAKYLSIIGRSCSTKRLKFDKPKLMQDWKMLVNNDGSFQPSFNLLQAVGCVVEGKLLVFTGDKYDAFCPLVDINMREHPLVVNQKSDNLFEVVEYEKTEVDEVYQVDDDDDDDYDYDDDEEKEEEDKEKIDVLEWIKGPRDGSRYVLDDNLSAVVTTLCKAAKLLGLTSKSYSQIPKGKRPESAESTWDSLFDRGGSGYPRSVRLGRELFSLARQLGIDVVFFKDNVLQDLPHHRPLATDRIYIVQDRKQFKLLTKQQSATSTNTASAQEAAISASQKSQPKQERRNQAKHEVEVMQGPPSNVVNLDGVRIVGLNEDVF